VLGLYTMAICSGQIDSAHVHGYTRPCQAWDAGIFVGYYISHFRPGFPEVSDRHKTRATRRDSGEVLPADPAALALRPCRAVRHSPSCM
jgi:hypothetical protein